MATQRYISTSFWDDEWVMTLSETEKFLYLYLMTNSLTNIAGVYKITVRRMSFDTRISEKKIEDILKSYAQAKKAYHFSGYIIIPSWPKHQQWETRSKIKQGIDLVLKDIPKQVLDYLYEIRYRYHIEGYQYDSNYSDLDSDLDREVEVDVDTEGISRKPRKSTVFIPPSLLEISQYCQERGNMVNAEVFFDHYESNGWKVGKNGMRDWRAAVRTWEKSEYSKVKPEEMTGDQIRAMFEQEEREKAVAQ